MLDGPEAVAALAALAVAFDTGEAQALKADAGLAMSALWARACYLVGHGDHASTGLISMPMPTWSAGPCHFSTTRRATC